MANAGPAIEPRVSQDVAERGRRVDRHRVAQPLRRHGCQRGGRRPGRETVASELGYVANVHARTLAGGSTSCVGLIVHEIGDPYFSEIASGVLARSPREQGLTVQICHSGRDPQRRAAARSAR